MNMFPRDTAKSWFSMLSREMFAWGKTEGSDWAFVIKTPLAALLAMLIAMRLDLDQPRTAMITVFVVMQPQTGLILAKSLYRIAGTLAGIAASLVLVSLFSQEPELFILGLALWIGLCTAGAAFYRNFKSYGFLLAGYTVALVGLPAALHPEAFFSLATTRLSEIMLGLVCAGIFGDTIFPRRLSDTIIRNVQSRYTDFIALVRASLSGTVGKEELERMHLRLVKDVIGLESIRSAAILEDPEVRARDFRLRRLNGEFMATSATFHSFYQLKKRLTQNGTPAGRALEDLYESFGQTVVTKGEPPRSAAAAQGAARRIAAFRVQLTRRVAKLRLTLSGGEPPRDLTDFDTAVELLFRFLRELHAYTRTYATLPDREQGPKPPDDIRFASRTDPLLALMSGARALVGILLVGTFWIASSWPYGASALMFVAIVSALCSTSPNPPRTAKQMVLGFVCGFLPALMYKFLLLPELDGAVLLAASMAPFLLFGSYLAAGKEYSGAGAGFLVFFTSMVAPGNSMQFDPVDVMNDGSATIIGVAVAGVMFGTLIPATGLWYRRRQARLLRHLAVLACLGPHEGLTHRFESGTHDVLHALASTREAAQLLGWMFPVIEAGRAVIRLRKDAHSIRLSQRLTGLLKQSLDSTARLFRAPSASQRDAALDCVTQAIEAISREAESGRCDSQDISVLRRMLTSLHLIRTVLLEEVILASMVPCQPTTVSGGLVNAA